MKNSACLILSLSLLVSGTALARSPKRQIICCPPPVTCYVGSPVHCAQFPLADDGVGNYFFYIDYYQDGDGQNGCTDGPYTEFGWYPDTTASPQDCTVPGQCEGFAPMYTSSLRGNAHQLKATIKQDDDITDRVMPVKAWEGKNKTGNEWTPPTGTKTLATKWINVVTKKNVTIPVKVLTIELNLKDAKVSAAGSHRKATRIAVFALQADVMPTNEQGSAPTIQGNDLKVDPNNHFKGEITLPGSKKPKPVTVVTNTELW